jgi:hypothetical protein
MAWTPFFPFLLKAFLGKKRPPQGMYPAACRTMDWAFCPRALESPAMGCTSPNPKFPTAKAPRTPWLMAEWKGTNGTSEDPKSAFSDPPVRNRKNRILGGLGVMAVQSFSRIRASLP